MPCYGPMVALPMPGKTQKGKTPFKFIGKASSIFSRTFNHKGAILCSCKQCVGCRLESSRQWAARIMHETKFHTDACFLTLTYDEDKLPETYTDYGPVFGSLVPDDLSGFFKRLRARYQYYGKEKIKYFACGEYGDRTNRPHYHAVIFGPVGVHGADSERVEEEFSRSGGRQFSHSDFSSSWEFGLHRFSEVTFESAAYVARYILKKVSGVSAEDAYGDLRPEFARMSKGLGADHFETWKSDIYPSDQVVFPGRGAFLPPAYYDRLLERADPKLFAKVKEARKEAHEEMTKSEWFARVGELRRIGEVRKLVTDATLIRGGVV